MFKLKRSNDLDIQQFKAFLVAQGFYQQYAEVCDEAFAPVVTQTTLCTLLSVAAKEKLTVYLLKWQLSETLYMKQPPGFIKGESPQTCLLKKSIYGLKQAASIWNEAVQISNKARQIHVFIPNDHMIICVIF